MNFTNKDGKWESDILTRGFHDGFLISCVLLVLWCFGAKGVYNGRETTMIPYFVAIWFGTLSTVYLYI